MAIATIAGDVQCAGTDVALLPAAVQQRRCSAASRRSSSAPDAVRAAELVAGHADRRPRRTGGEVDGQDPTAWTASVCSGTPYSAATAASSRDRHDGADLVVGPHHRHQRDALGASRERGAQGRRRAPARAGPTGSEDDLGALVLGEPLGRRPARRGARSRRRASRRAARVGVAPRPVEALDGQVVALGAAGGEDDLGRPRAQRRGDPLARLLDEPARPAARGVQRRGVADVRAAPRPSPRRPRAASAWWRRGRGRSWAVLRSRMSSPSRRCAGVPG